MSWQLQPLSSLTTSQCYVIGLQVWPKWKVMSWLGESTYCRHTYCKGPGLFWELFNTVGLPDIGIKSCADPFFPLLPTWMSDLLMLMLQLSKSWSYDLFSSPAVLQAISVISAFLSTSRYACTREFRVGRLKTGGKEGVGLGPGPYLLSLLPGCSAIPRLPLAGSDWNPGCIPAGV